MHEQVGKALNFLYFIGSTICAEAFLSTKTAMTGIPIAPTPTFLHPRSDSSIKFRLASTASPSSSASTSQSKSDASSGKIRGVIFDIDGTLADSWNLGYQATLTVLTEHHNNNKDNCENHTTETYPLTPEEYHFGCRYTTPERLARHVGLDPGHPSFESVGEELGKKFDDYYVELVDRSTAGFYDGIADLLVKLHCGDLASTSSSESTGDKGVWNGGVQLGALTNACVEYAHAVLKANCPRFSGGAPADGEDKSIYNRFTSIHGANSVPRPKPFGDGILLCCSEMNLDPSEVIYVGDAPTDARAAVDANCRAAIGVLWGSNSEECLKEENGFDVLCKNVEELETAIGYYL